MYIERRYSGMRDKAEPISTIVKMGLRIGILLLLLCCGKWACDKAVDVSHNHVSDYELNQYNKSELRHIYNLRRKKIITDKEAANRIKILETDTKGQIRNKR